MGFSKIATGNNFVIGILEGLVTIFGPNSIVKQDLSIITDATDVFAADDIAFAIRGDGTLTGFGSMRNERLPILMALGPIKTVCITPDSVVCLQQDGALKAWGTGASRIPADLLTSKVTSISTHVFDVTATLENGQLIQFNLRE